VLALIILFVIVIRVRLLDLPLERDEGEFAYVGQLMLEGVAPYKLAYVIKLPGTAAVYALSMALFGQTTAGIHLGLLLANVTAIVLMFLLAKRWFGAGAGLVASTTYALMSLSWGVDGNAAHATQFIVPAALGGILLLFRSLGSGRLGALFWSGILFGLAFLFKQPGILFGAFGGFCLLANELKARPVHGMSCLKKAAIYCLGIILPFAVLCLILWRAGVFERFWYWSFTVAEGGWSSGQNGWVNLTSYVRWLRISWQLPFWILAGLTLPFVFWMRSARPVRLSFLAFCGASILAVSVGLRLNPHYFVLALPAVAMLIGLGVVEVRRLLKNSQAPAFISFLPAALFICVCAGVVFADRLYLFSDTPDQIAEEIYHGNPFIAAVQVAGYIKQNSTPDSRIAVLGSEPEIYFYARRRSATGHVSVYILTGRRPYSHAMQEEMIREIKAARPEYIILINSKLSWLAPLQFADNTLLDAMAQYVQERYQLVGVVSKGASPGQSVYQWDAEALHPPANARPRNPTIFVFKIQKE